MSQVRLDPEVRALVERVIASDRCQLGLPSRERLLRGLDDNSIVVPLTRAGMNSAERHLLGVHRHELAHGLAVMGIGKLAEERAQLTEFVGFESVRSVPPDRCEALLARSWHEASRPLEELSSSQLLVLSLRVRNEASARIALGLSEAVGQRYEHAKRILSGMSHWHLTDVQRISLLHDLGFCSAGQGELRSALIHYAEACRFDPDTAWSTFGPYLYATALGLASEARSYGDRLRGQAGSWQSERFLAIIRELPEPARRSFTPEGRALALRDMAREDVLSEVAKEIANVQA